MFETTWKLYQEFRKASGSTEHPFQEAWDAYQDNHGEIEPGSDLEMLILEAMLFAVERIGNENAAN